MTNVAVVGGGLAGITAAIVAREAGAQVTLIEKSTLDGGAGNFRISNGTFHLAWGDLREDEASLMERLVRETGGEISDDSAALLAGNAGRAIAWLEGKGVTFAARGPHPHDQLIIEPHSPAVGARFIASRAPDITIRSLYEDARRLGVEVLLGAAPSRVTPSSPVGWEMTVVREGEPAATRTFDTVVFADGGFQNNNEMLTRYVGPHADRCFKRTTNASTGDGMRLLMDLGAGFRNLGRVYGHTVSVTVLERDDLWPHPTLDKLCLQGALVNRFGQLVETRGRTGTLLNNELSGSSDPTGHCVIIDQDIRRTVTSDNAVGATRESVAQREGHLSRFEILEHKGARLIESDSVDELAGHLGIDPRLLNDAVHTHNARQPEHRLASPPFIAVPILPSISFTMGGVVTNGRGQVRDLDGREIPGLYAAGDITCVHGGPTGGYIGGLAVTLIQGLVAGEAAAGNEGGSA